VEEARQAEAVPHGERGTRQAQPRLGP
jgi:hypothetical protein